MSLLPPLFSFQLVCQEEQKELSICCFMLSPSLVTFFLTNKLERKKWRPKRMIMSLLPKARKRQLMPGVWCWNPRKVSMTSSSCSLTSTPCTLLLSKNTTFASQPLIEPLKGRHQMEKWFYHHCQTQALEQEFSQLRSKNLSTAEERSRTSSSPTDHFQRLKRISSTFVSLP